MEKVFLEKEELDNLKNLQTTEDEIITQLGQIEYQFQLLNNKKENLNKSILSLQTEKDKMGKFLQEKYGEGAIDASSGEFIKDK